MVEYVECACGQFAPESSPWHIPTQNRDDQQLPDSPGESSAPRYLGGLGCSG